MKSSMISRGDLLRAIMENEGKQLLPESTEALGFIPQQLRPKDEKKTTPDEIDISNIQQNQGDPKPQGSTTPEPVPFWQPRSFFPDQLTSPAYIEAAVKTPAPSRKKDSSLPYKYLSSFEDLVPRLRNVLAELRMTGSYDIPRMVDRLGRGEFLHHLPRLHRQGWGGTLYVVEDRSDHLAPYVRDQAWLQSRLSRMYSRYGFHEAVYNECLPGPMVWNEDEGFIPMAPQPGDQILVLGDLGALARDGGSAVSFWRDQGEKWNHGGLSALALLPCSPLECAEEMAYSYRLMAWEHPSPVLLSSEELEEKGTRLLAHLSTVSRVEPGLLRAIRYNLGVRDYPTRLESWVWQHHFLENSDLVATAVKSKNLHEQQQLFKTTEDAQTAADTFRLAREAMNHLPYELWLETVLNFRGWKREIFTEQEQLDGVELLNYLAGRVSVVGSDPFSPRAKQWLEGLYDRLDTEVINGADTKSACWAIKSYLHGGKPPLPTDSPVRLHIYHQGDQLHFHEQPDRYGSPVAAMSSRDGLIRVETTLRKSFWHNSAVPTWAKRWGTDRYGAWVEFEYGGVVQRMRWIEPGEFLMGSPEDEEGRRDNEGPQHVVRLTRGYWLFDTPVTQVLWEVVMGGNPRRFKSSNRPVEQVSWDDCTKFIETINRELVGLALSLPSEAQWEYGCRAGRTDALYTGSMKILGANHGPALDPIAWYGGNSGVDFELANGHDSSEWPEKQYQHTKAGIHPVKKKAPNTWGLYDMLGNVDEWCLDGKRDYSVEDAEDPLGDTEPGAERVIRGGSWVSKARYCRCAFRNWLHPGSRIVILGFRCARVQVSSAGQAAGQGQPAASAMGRPVEPGRTPAEVGKRSSTIWLLDGRKNEPLILPGDADAVELRLRSDREQLILRRAVKPSWAKAMGRDRFGLWVEIEYKGVRQRMRWIPPGRFMMGSPDDEPGRWDDEGPQHPVTLEKGYWLFDTPVTQSLWQAVIGKNPSKFQTENRPVETVSWDDCQEFLTEINKQVKGFNLSLPSEAQWEYACRAGSTTALYIGPIDIIGERNAPALDKIAWYGGNCGRDFELENGFDISKWKDKQYDDPKGGTHPVAAKLPNDWGLYDMLGNVWEWCADEKHENYKGAPEDGKPWVSNEPGAVRVVRGGSWDCEARHCRCASRGWAHPDYRVADVGFRCARVQE